MPYRMGGGGGSTVTAGGLVLRGEPDGNFVALDAKTGEVLWQFQTGFGADAPPMVYEVDGEQYIAIAAGGNQDAGQRQRRRGVDLLAEGQLEPLWPPPPPATVAGPTRTDRRQASTRSRSATTTSSMAIAPARTRDQSREPR